MVLTRLHARYTKDTVGEDLVFKAAPAVIGGRGTPNNKGDFDEKGAKPDSYANNFQGRYGVLHRWEGKVECQTPVWGRWGGPLKLPSGVKAANPLPPTDVAPSAKPADPKPADPKPEDKPTPPLCPRPPAVSRPKRPRAGPPPNAGGAPAQDAQAGVSGSCGELLGCLPRIASPSGTGFALRGGRARGGRRAAVGLSASPERATRGDLGVGDLARREVVLAGAAAPVGLLGRGVQGRGLAAAGRDRHPLGRAQALLGLRRVVAPLADPGAGVELRAGRARGRGVAAPQALAGHRGAQGLDGA